MIILYLALLSRDYGSHTRRVFNWGRLGTLSDPARADPSKVSRIDPVVDIQLISVVSSPPLPFRKKAQNHPDTKPDDPAYTQWDIVSPNNN
jgi:hypothetical protein